jgi:hypothetical protein
VADLVYRDELSEVWCGQSLEASTAATALAGRQVDLLLFDAPYSERTHAGFDAQAASLKTSWARNHAGRPTKEQAYGARVAAGKSKGRSKIKYPPWGALELDAFCAVWLPQTTGWAVTITDHTLASAWADRFDATNRLTFPPLPLVETGSRVRMSGDGPSNWTCWIVAARPRGTLFASWGTLPGAYVQPAERDFNSNQGTDRIVGAKPLQSMLGLVRDYSRPGSLVVDPCCGGGTTLAAAKILGRRSVGIDSDHHHCELTAKRLRDTREQTILRLNDEPSAEQRGLFDLQDREKLYPGDQPPVMKGLP